MKNQAHEKNIKTPLELSSTQGERNPTLYLLSLSWEVASVFFNRINPVGAASVSQAKTLKNLERFRRM